MKSRLNKKLTLGRETVRALTLNSAELARAVGGISGNRGCTSIDLACPGPGTGFGCASVDSFCNSGPGIATCLC